MSKPTPEALEALRLSVKVWDKKLRDFQEGKAVSFSPHDCPCCDLFFSAYRPKQTCRECAIREFTGKTYCHNTPFWRAEAVYRLGHRAITEKAILAERDFLKQLYEYYTKERT